MTTKPRARLSLNPLLVDATIAFGLSALSLLAVAGGASEAGRRDALSITLLLLETLPLLGRRRWPIPVLVITLAATILHASLVEGAVVNESLGALVALFTVAERYDRRVSIAATFAVGWRLRRVDRRAGRLPDRGLRVHPDDALRRHRVGARRLGAHATPLRGRDRGERPAPGSRSRGTGPPGRPGRTRADRPRAARHRDPPCQRDRHPGRGRPDGARAAAGPGEDRPRGHRPDEPRGAHRHAPDARDPGREPASTDDPITRAAARPRPPGRAHRGGPRRRPAGRALHRRRSPAARRRASSCRPTGSSRRPSPMRSSMRAGPARACACGTRNEPSRSRSPTRAARVARPRRSGDRRPRADRHAGARRPLSAASSTPARQRAGSAFVPACPSSPTRGGVMTAPIRVLLVDDQELVRTGFRMILDGEADIEVVGEAADGKAGVEAATPAASRRGGHGHPHAGPRRHRGHPPDRPRRASPRTPGCWS